jgi:y4mF family transcriptional regulator
MATKTTTEIAAIARDRRLMLGLTQDRLAEAAGVSRKWIVEFETGKPTVQFAAVMHVLSVLSIDVGELNEAGPSSASVDSGGGDRSAQLAISERIRSRAASARFGADLLARGISVVGLDAEDRIVRYEPDGTSTLVS